jgi:glutaredoxin 3
MYQEEILIYAGAHRRYLRRIKRLLKRKGYAFEETDIDEGMRARLIETTKGKTMPLIFLGGRPLGGFDDIRALDRSGDLDRLVRGRA